MRIQEFNFSVDLLQVLLWEYNEAGTLQTLISKKQAWYNINQTQFWSDWFINVFNLQTANDFGLSVWAIILNIPLDLDPPPDPPGKFIFGFESTHKNFNNGNFTTSGSTVGLTTEEKRVLLRLRYYQLVSRGAIPESNLLLQDVFELFGNVYLLDSLDMTEVCVFNFYPSVKLRLILQKYDLIPRPSGVKLRYRDGTRATFGFGNVHKNFNNGNFIGEF